jgi:thioredoxin reductase
MTTYDTIIVGGGPAGLTAAIHLAWHNRPVLVIDRRTGPLFFTLERLYNVPGMPECKGIELQRGLRRQAEEMGVEFLRANVIEAKGEDGHFTLRGEKDESWQARTLLLATGLARYHPTAEGDYRACFAYAGKGNLFYCPDCEGPMLTDKDTVVISVGPADWAASMAVGMSRYARKLRVLLTADTEMSPHHRERRAKKGIGVVTGAIQEFVGRKGQLEAVKLDDGSSVEAEAWLVSSPNKGRTELAQQLGVEMAATGIHAQPKSQRGDTNVPGVWIAGDLRPMTQQVAVAMGTGNIAAVMIDQHLRKQEVAG